MIVIVHPIAEKKNFFCLKLFSEINYYLVENPILLFSPNDIHMIVHPIVSDHVYICTCILSGTQIFM